MQVVQPREEILELKELIWITMSAQCIGILLFFASCVFGQSDFMCPPNNKMGLCEQVPAPCFTDADCYEDQICCPHACSRTCKPKKSVSQARGGANEAASQVPDLLNDPRVYVGRCPDSSCFTMFPEPDECSTSNLCPTEQYCCNNGCNNVCLVKPQYAAIIAEREAKLRQHQQLMHQKQQEEMVRRQQEMFAQQQRQAALAEQARLQAKARASAEAELAAQQARAKYESELKLKAEAEAAKRNRQMAQQQAAALLQQQSQATQFQQAPNPQTPTSSGGFSFLDNFVDGPQKAGTTANAAEQPQAPSKFSELAGNAFGPPANLKSNAFAAQVNSLASVNPYSFAPQQNIYNKNDYAPGASASSLAQDRLVSLILPQTPPPPPPPNVARLAAPKMSPPVSYPRSGYPYPQASRNQARQEQVDPYLMYHFMQTAV
ncbi:hypothetical protein Btru_055384 [Bulinus truncatus]|nr:hypothetical protein Btru_055384 [Bulinus truncatus]